MCLFAIFLRDGGEFFRNGKDAQHTDYGQRDSDHTDQTAPADGIGSDLCHCRGEQDIKYHCTGHRKNTAVTNDFGLLFLIFEGANHVHNIVGIQERNADGVHKGVHTEDPDALGRGSKARRAAEQQPCGQPQEQHKNLIRATLTPAGLRAVDNKARNDIGKAVKNFADHEQCAHQSRGKLQYIGTIERDIAKHQCGQCYGTGTGVPQKQLAKTDFFGLALLLARQLFFFCHNDFSFNLCGRILPCQSIVVLLYQRIRHLNRQKLAQEKYIWLRLPENANYLLQTLNSYF